MSDPDTKRAQTYCFCRVCAHELPEMARKCTKCGEFQSWHWRVLSSQALNGLVSLLPLLTLIFVFLGERLKSDSAHLALVPLRCTKTEVELVGSNLGKHYAAITSANYSVGGEWAGTLVLDGSAEDRIFLEKDSHVVRWRAAEPGGLAPHGSANVPECLVDLTFSIYESKRGNRVVALQCDCPAS